MKRKELLLGGCVLSLLLLNASAATLYVDINSTNAVSPYADWTTAATNIQDAIDAAAPGDTVLVTNGVYATGGKVMAGDLTNRVVLDKAVTVTSVNGYAATIIQGYGVSPASGPFAVRCAWLADGATLSGFTLCNGATRTNGDSVALQSGGGVWCSSTNAVVANCLIGPNSAANSGGGAFQGTFTNCRIAGNIAALNGGGVYQGSLINCRIVANVAALNGGGAYQGNLNNCRVLANVAGATQSGYGGGVYQGTLISCALIGNTLTTGIGGGSCDSTLINCTVSGNMRNGISGGRCTNCILYSNPGLNNYFGICTFSYCCTTPLPSGTGNISTNPQLLSDGFHLAATSPCRGKGNSTVVTGVDIDGQTWSNPPSIGCSRVAASARYRPAEDPVSAVPFGFSLGGVAAGQAPFWVLLD